MHGTVTREPLSMGKDYIYDVQDIRSRTEGLLEAAGRQEWLFFQGLGPNPKKCWAYLGQTEKSTQCPPGKLVLPWFFFLLQIKPDLS